MFNKICLLGFLWGFPDNAFRINFRYNLPEINWIRKYFRISNSSNLIFGSDAHDINDLYKSWEVKQEYINHCKGNSYNNIVDTTFLDWFVEKYPDGLKIKKSEH